MKKKWIYKSNELVQSIRYSGDILETQTTVKQDYNKTKMTLGHVYIYMFIFFMIIMWAILTLKNKHSTANLLCNSTTFLACCFRNEASRIKFAVNMHCFQCITGMTAVLRPCAECSIPRWSTATSPVQLSLAYLLPLHCSSIRQRQQHLVIEKYHTSVIYRNVDLSIYIRQNPLNSTARYNSINANNVMYKDDWRDVVDKTMIYLLANT